jgi:hypothetical protein
MSRAPRSKAPETALYHVTDKSLTEINGRRLTPADHKNGVQLTPHEAAFYVAGGAISTQNPAESAGAQEAVKRVGGRQAPAAPEGTTAAAVKEG